MRMGMGMEILDATLHAWIGAHLQFSGRGNMELVLLPVRKCVL